MSYTVLARRYRSRDFDELIGQEPIAQTLRNAIASGRTAHAYLFCGTRGVGKTSLARLFAKAINVDPDLEQSDAIADAILRGEDLDVIEIDGASNRGIQEAKDLIAGAGLSPARSPYKIYIIDEVHALTRDAFNALLKTMEEPPRHVKFILCTTEPHKVPATIQSRCQRFDFQAIPATKIAGQLRRILEKEGIEADDDVVAEVARLGNGSMRDALSLLDRLIAGGEPTLTRALAEQMLGLPDQTLLDRTIDAIVAGDAGAGLEAGAKLLAGGATIPQALDLLAERFRMLMLAGACGADSDLLDGSPESIRAAAEQAQHFDVAALVYMIALCDSVARSARDSTAARALFDAALVRLCLSEHFADIAGILASGTSGDRGKKKALEPTPHERPAAPPAPLIEVKQAPGPPAPVKDGTGADGDDGAALWRRVLSAASAAPKDEARVRHLEYQSFDGRTMTLTVTDAGTATARYMATQVDRLGELVERATGRKVKVALEAPRAEPRRAPEITGSRLAEVHDLPAVRRAVEIFDAAVFEVQDEPAEPAGPGNEGRDDV